MKVPGYSPSVQKEFDQESQELQRLASRTRKAGRTVLRLEDGHFKTGQKGRFKYWGLKALRTVAPYLGSYCDSRLLKLQHLNDSQQKAAATRIAHMVRHEKTQPVQDPDFFNTPLSKRKVMTVKEALNFVNQHPSQRVTADRSTWVIPPTLEKAKEIAAQPEPEKKPKNDRRPDPVSVEDKLQLEYRVVPDANSVARKLGKAKEEIREQQQAQQNFHNTLDAKPFPKLTFPLQGAHRLREMQESTLEEYSESPDLTNESGSFTRESKYDKTKSTINYETEGVQGYSSEIGIAHCQGLRKRMEDQTLCTSFTVHTSHGDMPVNLTALFDGHGGTTGSEYASEHLARHLKQRLEEGNPEELTDTHVWNALKLAFVDLGHSIPYRPDGFSAGTTANAVLQIGDKLWVANTGDSRAVLIPPEGNAEQLSLDAKPNDPRFKPSIEKRDGKITGNEIYGYRVNGVGTARALGDHETFGAVSSRPTITMYESPPEGWQGYKLLQACDGLTDLTTSEQIGGLVQKATAKNMDNGQIAGFLTGLAYEAGSGDNISVMLMSLK